MKKGITYFALVSLMVFVLGLVTVSAVIIEADIDVKPGSYPNSICLKSRGVLPVAILSTDVFDALNVDVPTVMLTTLYNGGEYPHPLRWAIEDVNDDGYDDLILIFRTSLLGITCEDEVLIMTGETWDGIPFEGVDMIRPVCMDQPK